MFALADQVEPMTSQNHLPGLRAPSAQRRSIRLPPQATQSGMQMHHLLRQHWTLMKAKQKHPGRKITPVMIYCIALLQAQLQVVLYFSI